MKEEVTLNNSIKPEKQGGISGDTIPEDNGKKSPSSSWRDFGLKI